MLKRCPPGTIRGANSSGWSNNKFFLELLRHFKKHLKSTQKKFNNFNTRQT